jgi:hypothetical protein
MLVQTKKMISQNHLLKGFFSRPLFDENNVRSFQAKKFFLPGTFFYSVTFFYCAKAEKSRSNAKNCCPSADNFYWIEEKCRFNSYIFPMEADNFRGSPATFPTKAGNN